MSMHIPNLLLVTAAVVGIVSAAISNFLALRIFGFKDSSANGKIIGTVVLYDLIAVVIILSVHSAYLGLILILAGLAVWTLLIKRYAQNLYTFGKAIGSYATSYIFAAVFSSVLAILTVTSFVQTFRVSSQAMMPALHESDRVLVYKFEKHPSVNSIIIYKSGASNAIGRVKSGPGGTVAIPQGQVVISGQDENLATYNLRPNEYLVSADSGQSPSEVVSSNNIVGTVGPKL